LTDGCSTAAVSTSAAVEANPALVPGAVSGAAAIYNALIRYL